MKFLKQMLLKGKTLRYRMGFSNSYKVPGVLVDVVVFEEYRLYQYKGKDYVLLGEVTDKDTDEVKYLYRDNKKLYVRNKKDFKNKFKEVGSGKI